MTDDVLEVDSEPKVRFKSPRRARRNLVVKFGYVNVSGAGPSKEMAAKNVALSSEALERVAKKIKQIRNKGVHIRFKIGVPRYYADEEEPGIFFRVLDGKVERGRLVNGEFKVQT